MQQTDAGETSFDLDRIGGFRSAYKKVDAEMKKLKRQVKSIQEQLINIEIHMEQSRNRLIKKESQGG